MENGGTAAGYGAIRRGGRGFLPDMENRLGKPETPRFRHVIYSFRYGSELESLIGRDAEYAASAAPSMAEEALEADGRFSRVTAGSFSAAGDRIAGTVTVTAGSGSFRVDAAV